MTGASCGRYSVDDEEEVAAEDDDDDDDKDKVPN